MYLSEEATQASEASYPGEVVEVCQAGIDTEAFSAHSTRSASTSKARMVGVSLEDIVRAANWSSTSTFSRFYHRPVVLSQFGRGILTSRLQTHLGEL